MEAIFCVGFFAFLIGLIAGATLAYAVLSAREDSILECTEELSESFGKTMIYSMDKMYEYGQKVKELEEKQIKDYFDNHNGGAVSPNKVVDIDKLKDEFEKEQQKQ